MASFQDLFTGSDASAWNVSKWTTSQSNGTVNIQSNRGRLAVTGNANAYARAIATTGTLTDIDMTFSFAWSATTASNPSLVFYVGFRSDGAWSGSTFGASPNCYLLTFTNYAASPVSVGLSKRISDVGTSLGSFTIPLDTSRRNVRIVAAGSRLKIKVWLATDPEPKAWSLKATDSSRVSGVAQVGLRRTSNGSGNVELDDFNVGDVASSTTTQDRFYRQSGSAVLTTRWQRVSGVGQIIHQHVSLPASAPGDPWSQFVTYSPGDRVTYAGMTFEALQTVSAVPPLGVGDGSTLDQDLLLARAAGYANWVTGGQGKPVYTVTNANNSGAGSLRQAITDAKGSTGGWIIFDPTFNSGVYSITLASDLVIAGTGAQNITIDGRGAAVTINGGGSPGGQGVGTLGYAFNIGGSTYSQFSAGGNTTPAGNIIVCGINIVSNWGGEDGDNGTHGDVTMLYWARGIWFDHCYFTNPDPNHDGLFDISYGATEVTVSWCKFYRHWKLHLIYGNSPSQGAWPPGHSAVSPGNYQVGSTGAPKVLVTEHHNWFSEYGTRAPEVKNANAFIHQYNNYLSDYGYNKDGSNNVAYPWLTAGNASGYTPVWTGGMLKNGGVGSYAEAGGHMYVDNNIYRATTGASGNAREGASNFGGSPTPTLYVTGSLLENGAIKDGNSPDSGFTPSTVYSYNPDTANAALKQRLIDEAGQSRYWAAG